MDEDIRVALIYIIFVEIVIVLLLLGYILVNHERLFNKPDCTKIVGCDIYKCLSEQTLSESEKQIYLLKENNCLLKEALTDA